MHVKLAIALCVTLLLACRTQVKIEPVEVKPITMTIEINVKVDRQLDEFFDFEKADSPAPESTPSSEAEDKPSPKASPEASLKATHKSGDSP